MTVEFLFDNEIVYFNARSKGLVQANNSKHFPIDQYLHNRVTPATVSLKPLAYDKPIHPSEMPTISTCTDTNTDDTNVHLKLKDETPFFVHPYPMRKEQKKVIRKEMDGLEHSKKGLPATVHQLSSSNERIKICRVCSDFKLLNEKLLKINHAFPLVRDCIEQLGRNRCDYMSTIDL